MRFLSVAAAVFGLNVLNAVGELVGTELPHLIIPLDKRVPDKVLGTQYSADVEHAVYTEVLFDVPSNEARYCGLNFYIGDGPWELWGDYPYRFTASIIVGAVINKDQDTWNKHPTFGDWVATIQVDHDKSVSVTSANLTCAKGQTAQFVLRPEDPNRDFGFTWWEEATPLHGITYEMFT